MSFSFIIAVKNATKMYLLHWLALCLCYLFSFSIHHPIVQILYSWNLGGFGCSYLFVQWIKETSSKVIFYFLYYCYYYFMVVLVVTSLTVDYIFDFVLTYYLIYSGKKRNQQSQKLKGKETQMLQITLLLLCLCSCIPHSFSILSLCLRSCQ